MHRLMHILAMVIAMAIGASTTAVAHPHIWAEARLEVDVGESREVNSLRHVWRFDELFSSTVLFEFDTDRDLQLSADELEVVASVIHESLAEFDYFQMVNRDGKPVAMEAPDRMIANFEGDHLIVAFESRPAETLLLDGKLEFGVYDPTFFTAIDFFEDEMMTVSGKPGDCQTEVIRPDPYEAIQQNQDTLTDAFFNEPGGVDYSSIFATRLQLHCDAALVTAQAQPSTPRPAGGSPLGIGPTETAMPSTGMFAGALNWINARQQEFYRSLTGSLRAMRDEGTGAWMLVLLSFAYGVFHAAGPGHGKAVISSYMLANEVALRRGVLLSFLSSMLQALTAIVVMGLLFLFLRGTAASISDTTRFLEISSYALVTAFGAWLLWRKAFPRVMTLFRGAPVRSLSAAAVQPAPDQHHDHDHAHDHHHHGPGEVCSTCGHSHAPDPKLISGDRFDWKTAWAAIVAVGVRPCTGALVVLSFAFLNGLWISGIVSVLAMAIGTAITVSVLATLAVTAKNWAVAISGEGRAADRIHAGIEIFGASLVFLLGVTLLMASLAV